jgi:hypothetical protein
MTEGTWLDSLQQQKICSRLNHQGLSWGPPSLLYSMGTFAVSPRRKTAGGEADHSPPSSVQMDNLGGLPSSSDWQDCNFESGQGYGCLSLLTAVFCHVEVSAPYRVRCVWERSWSLDNEEVLAYYKLSLRGRKKNTSTPSRAIMAYCIIKKKGQI